MITKYEKANKGKLLVAVLALFVVLAGAAVVLSDNGLDAAPMEEDNFTTAITNGTYNVTGDVEVTLTSTISQIGAGTSLEFTGSGTVTLTMAATSYVKQMFNGVTIKVGEGVTLILNMTASQALTDCHLLVNSDLEINGGTVTFKQAANAQGQSWWSSASDTLKITAGGKLIIDGANGFSGITATISGLNSGIEFRSTTSSAASMSFAAESEIDTNSTVTVNDSKAFVSFMGDATVNGTINAPSSEVRLYNGATITLSGTINAATINVKGGNSVSAGSISGGTVNANYVASTMEDAKALFDAKQTEVTIQNVQNLTIDENFTVPVNCTLNIKNSTLNGNGIMIVAGTLNLDNSYIYTGVYVDEEAGGMVNAINVHNLESSGVLQNDTKVGYGDTLTLSGTVPSGLTVDVYGTIIIGDVTINGTVNTYVGSTVNVTGAITVASNFTVTAGASMELTGTITVRNDTNGGATFTLDDSPAAISLPDVGSNTNRTVTLEASVTVTSNGTFTVSKPTSNAASSNNMLDVGTGAKFIVEGALTITGALDGQIQDKGTVTFNGTAVGSDAGIVVDDGGSSTITSVTGTLAISDSTDVILDYLGADKMPSYVKPSAGNVVTLTDVRGVTVAVAVAESYNEDSTETYCIANMTVTGSVSKLQSATSGSLELDNSACATVGTGDYAVAGKMSIIDTFAVGSDVTVTNVADSDITVTGDVNIVAEDAKMVNNGTITVTGTITVSDESGTTFTANIINAVYYVITDATDASFTYYYTSFANGIAAIGNADDDTVTVLGTVTVAADAEIPASATVAVQGSLIIDLDVTVTVADGGLLNITGTLVDVNGTLVITNSDSGLAGNTNNMQYDVYTLVEKVATYTSLANALANAASGETITLSQPVILESSITIPAGVTLQTGRNTITVEDGVTITVDGTLAIQNAEGIVTANANPALKWADDVRIIANGVVSSNADPEKYLISGAYYTSRGTYYVTSVAYAAENVHSGTVDIMGQVAMGDVTFTADRTMTVNIAAFDGTYTDAPDTAVTAGTVTLSNGVTLAIAAPFTGSVSAPATGSTANVQFAEAYGITVQSLTVTGASGSTDYLYLKATVDTTAITGDITVTAGTATVNGSTTVTGENSITVASGAVLDVPKDVTVTAGTNDDDKYVTLSVAGTMNVTGTVDVKGIAYVSGSVNVAKSNGAGVANLTVEGRLNVTGTVTISADEKNSGTLELSSGEIVVGAKPTTLGTVATGSIIGKITTLTTSTIKVYNGASVEETTYGTTALAEASGVKRTAYYINDTLYMTVYTNGSAQIVDTIRNDVTGNAGLQLNGLNTTGVSTIANWYTDSAMTTAMTVDAAIGTPEAVYFSAPAAKVTGTVSAGTGLDIYVDGVRYNSNDVQLDYGTHEVRVDVKSGYEGTPTITFNGQTVQNGGTITVTENGFTLTASGATPIDYSQSGSSNGMGIVEILLVILVVVVVILAIIVVLRMMRS